MTPKKRSREGAKAAKAKVRKYRIETWLNLAERTECYGIQARHSEKWLPCFLRSRVLIFRTRTTAVRVWRWLNNPSGTEPEWNDDLVVPQLTTAPSLPSPRRGKQSA